MRKLIPTLAAGAALFALPPAATAATSFDLGPGRFPDVAVDSGGTAHIVWDAGGTQVRYCQVPRGQTSCALDRTLTPPAEAIGRSTFVFLPSPNRVLIATHRCCSPDATLAYESNDNGQTFSGPVTIGDLDAVDAVYGPGDAVSGVDTGGRFQRMPATGPPATRQAMLPAGFSVPTASSLAYFGARPLKVSADGTDTTFSLHSGSGDPNDESTWGPPTPVAPAGSEPHLASTNTGLAMIYRTGRASEARLHARKFDGTQFGPATALGLADPIEADLSADSSGRFTAAWVENGLSPSEVRFAQSNDAEKWGKTAPILRGRAAADLFHTQVSTAPDGQGFAVFDANSPSGNITATPLEPFSDTKDPIATSAIADIEMRFFAPQACVQPPERVTLRVTSKRKRRLSPRRRVKITSVVFSVDRKKSTDRRAAFKALFSTATFERGTFHNVRAVVTLKPVVGKGRAKKKTLKGAFNVCG